VAVLAAAPHRTRAWDVLFDALLGARLELTECVRVAIQARVPAYRDIPRETLDDEIALEIERVLRSARAGTTAITDDEFAELANVGTARAQQGVPVDEMLHAWRIGVEVFVTHARAEGRRLGVDDALVLELVSSTLAASDLAMVTTADAHRKAGRTLVLAEGQRCEAFVRGTLFGTVPIAELRIQAEAYGLDPTVDYVATRARLESDAARHTLETALGFHSGSLYRRGLCAHIDGHLVGFLSEPPSRDVDAVVGLGPPRPLERQSESYQLAARALMTVQACRLKGAYDIPALGLRAAVAVDADVGESLRKRYLEPLAEGGSVRELMTTLRTYLACDMHVERTATRLFVHQNTVRYRLARFEELTGASLREAEVLFEVWWALQLSVMSL
jgi:PucR-like helix-turn-helix protein/diguanylate cyclase with GGDEF domain